MLHDKSGLKIWEEFPKLMQKLPTKNIRRIFKAYIKHILRIFLKQNTVSKNRD